MATITKCLKIKLRKPLNSTWDEFGKILRDLRYSSSKVLNLTVQRCYEWHNLQLIEKEKTGLYPKDKDVYGCVLSTQIYREARARYNIFNSGNMIQTIQMGIARWKTDKFDIMRLQKSIPSYKLNAPLFISAKVYRIEQPSDNEYVLSVGLLSTNYTKQNDIKQTQYNVLLEVNDKSTVTTLNKIISGTYKQGFAQMIFSPKKNNWFLMISYTHDCEIEKNSDIIMGVDLGIINPIYMALNNSLHRYSIPGGEIEQFKKQILKRKNQLLVQGKYCSDGRKGRGAKTRTSPIDFATQRVVDFKNTTNHKYSHFVVEMAKKHNVSLIHMENIEKIKTKSKFLKEWSYYDLQKKIEYKATQAGIRVHYIDPYKLRQRCSKCGYIAPENKELQLLFNCTKCEFEVNTDYNAAKNIATLNIEKLIEEKCKELNIEDIRNTKS